MFPSTNYDSRTTIHAYRRARGFSIVTAIFLLVVLSLLGAFIVSVTGLQQSSLQLDVQGVRAYQAARAGIEWGAYQVLDPNNSIGTPVLPVCPASPTNLSGLAGSLSPFTVTVTCSAAINAPTTEGNRNVGAYQIIATACNQPSAGACPNASPTSGYVERQLQATLSKCKDPAAAGPRFACS
jgi:MSHA biogenesis protein MshP